MRAGGVPGGADFSDFLAGLDRPPLHGLLGKVAVVEVEPADAQHEEGAETAVASAADDGTVAHRDTGLPLRSGVVRSGVTAQDPVRPLLPVGGRDAVPRYGGGDAGTTGGRCRRRDAEPVPARLARDAVGIGSLEPDLALPGGVRLLVDVGPLGARTRP